MPALPKLTGRTAEKRRRKILREFDSEEFRCPDGYIRVSGEISIDLKGEQNGRRREPTASISEKKQKNGFFPFIRLKYRHGDPPHLNAL